MGNESKLDQYKYVDTIAVSTRVVRLVWGVTYVLAFRSTPRWALHEWRSFILRLFGASVGKGCKISPTVKIYLPSNLVIGHFVAIGDNVDLYCMDRIVMGSKVAVSAGATLCTGSHDIRSLARPLITSPIQLGDHVWICTQAFIGPGVTVGEGSVVGACSVVVRSIPAWVVAVGNPAKTQKNRELK